MEKVTKEQEMTLSLMATGSYPGKDYDYRFTGRELSSVLLDQMLSFWYAESQQVFGLPTKLAAVQTEADNLRSQVKNAPMGESEAEKKLLTFRSALKDVLGD